MEWKSEILQDINVLPNIGTPGRIVVYGQSAEPILTGSNEEDVLVAAAGFGKGRIVAISHSGYASKFMENDNHAEEPFTKFNRNLRQWLTKGTYENEDSITWVTGEVNAEKLRTSKIATYTGDVCEIPLSDMVEYVRNGGALLYCLTPWGWQQVNDGKPLSEVPYIDLLIEAGVCFTEEYISEPAGGFSVKENKAGGAHLLSVLEEVGTNFDKALEKINMLSRLRYLPKQAILQFTQVLEKDFEICKEVLKNVPSAEKSVTDQKDRAILNLWLLCHDILQPPNTKAPGVDFFPEDFSTEPPLTSHTFEIHSDREDFHLTACYLPAGQILKVEVTSGNEGHDWELLIGCHTDELGNDELRRWPKVYKKVKLDQTILETSSPFGGLIYLISPNKPNMSIVVKLENVVDSPGFRLTEGEKGKERWDESRHSPGLWADICGEHVMITVLATSVREMEFDALTSVMKIWDSVARLCHDLRGIDVSKVRRTWFVTDLQTSGGSLHSGYPIVSHLDYGDPREEHFFFNGPGLQKVGSWGPFHEIGHNLQRDEWTIQVSQEVTANIFTLCAMEMICQLKPWIHSGLQWLLGDIEKHLKDGADYQTWKTNDWFALFFYAQLARDFGWDSYRTVFRRYEAMEESERPRQIQKKNDTWFTIFSETAGVNLAPLASFWNIPLSDEAAAHLQSAFPVSFLPDDEVTRFVPDRVGEILQKFPGIVRKI